jgi:hypothetical protein
VQAGRFGQTVAARPLQSLKLGKPLHQLLHAVLLKLYCNLGVVPVTFPTKDCSFSILWVPDANALL